MKKKFCIIVAMLGIYGYMIAQNTSKVASHTFVVDGELPIPTEKKELRNSEEIAKYWAQNERTGRVIATSWGKKSMHLPNQSVFFNCLVEAYAGHYSVILSPDIIWTVISQGFCHYISTNSEKLRDKIVNHEGKATISVVSQHDLYSPHVDWDNILDGFDKQIAENTNGNISDMMRADFSTTGTTERIASQVTLMSAVKSYFDFVAVHYLCGIPSITIEGTPDDWKKVMEKTEKLRNYDLAWWVEDLTPILQEFVKAAEGNADKSFWQNIVKKNRPEKLRKGDGCGLEAPSIFDGWFLKLMPFDKDGRTPETVVYGIDDMLTNVVSAPFTYVVKDLAGKIISQTPMDIAAGLVGIEIDDKTHTMHPKIGWMVSESNPKSFIEKAYECTNSVQRIRVSRIPEELKNIDHLEDLSLEFTGDVVIPEWMDKLKIDYIDIEGNITPELGEELKRRFKDREVKVYKTSVTISVKK